MLKPLRRPSRLPWIVSLALGLSLAACGGGGGGGDTPPVQASPALVWGTGTWGVNQFAATAGAELEGDAQLQGDAPVEGAAGPVANDLAAEVAR